MQKIMFNDRIKLTAAVLEGRKTMTRRVVKCPKNAYDFEVCQYSNGECSISLCDAEGFPVGELMPKYQVGEIVAVAQRYCDVLHCADVPRGDEKGWGNKMFVRAELMPHHIKITNVRVERLQDCSDEDCLKEGVQFCANCRRYTILDCDEKHCFETPREAFAALIDKVSGKGTWESNPYCFCYTFELID